MRLAVAIVICAGALACGRGVATAAVFEVRSCGASAPTAFSSTNSSPQTIAVGSRCPPESDELLTGLSLRPREDSSTANGQSAGWTIAAPAGLILRRLDVRRSIGTRRDGWKVRVRTAEGTLLESCELNGRDLCQRGDPEEDDEDVAASYPNLSTRSVTFAIECQTTGGTCAGRSTPQAWVALYSATAFVEDPTPPVVEPLGGALVASGWHSGSERVDVAAGDASGIRSLSLFVDDTKLYEQAPSCDYTRMQPCPAGLRDTVTVDTSGLADGIHQVRAVATDAASQSASASGVLRLDRQAPDSPTAVTITRNADATLALSWANPDQGAAAPIAGARFAVCDAVGANCAAAGTVAGAGVARVDSIAVPIGEHVIKLWLQDEAGNSDPAKAATFSVDPSTVISTRVVPTKPPVLRPSGLAPSPRMVVKRARRSGATLTLSGTIVRGATASIVANVARSRNGRRVAGAKIKPQRGKWSLQVRLTPGLRRASTIYLTLRFTGQSSYRTTTLHRRLASQPGRGGALSVSPSAR